LGQRLSPIARSSISLLIASRLALTAAVDAFSGGWYLDQPEAPHAHRRRYGAGPLVGLSSSLA